MDKLYLYEKTILINCCFLLALLYFEKPKKPRAKNIIKKIIIEKNPIKLNVDRNNISVYF